ncbi:hypothetical protein DFR72_119219 [Lentzea flaviverrucosa]|uniref:Uncharacterized protein n=1 Tax=Lentzea flaviverrucosa TaxID=200379 RepID=A0A1H9XW01_9PSEU|nr:hypothetical protein DFR72_119219 [Lentzea flaviverrucosa]SES50362.1 hypothetical protein SAMN05216195_119219 [Lentzea flaviverrucosa]
MLGVVQVLPGVDAAALVLRDDARAQEMVSASDGWAASVEEVQYTLDEGPAAEALQAVARCWSGT